MGIELNQISTEQRNQKSMQIDTASTLEMITIINNEDKLIALAIENILPQIAEAVDVIYNRLSKGGRLIYIGAGTSGRLGILDAVECPPTYGVTDEMVTALIAGGDSAFLKAVEGAEDNREFAKADLIKIAANFKDVIVGIAASGRTPYVLSGMEYAKECGCAVISLCCSHNETMENLSDISLVPLVGPEVVTGSTRMKSGTAQKMILNMLSTATMIKLGKVYENLMVDVKSTNEKLVERAKQIVCQATGVSEQLAQMALTDCNNSVKHAIIELKVNVNYDRANEMLKNNNNNISQALNNHN